MQKERFKNCNKLLDVMKEKNYKILKKPSNKIKEIKIQKHREIKPTEIKPTKQTIIYYALIVVVLIAVLIGFYYYRDFKRTKRVVEKSCGTIQGYVLQSIADDGQCKQFCTVRCESEQLRLKKSFFEQGSLGECNSCTCICH